MTWTPPTTSSTARGYGASHRNLRAKLLPHAYDTPCARCGQPMLQGQALELDHNDTRTGYLGFSHKRCNRKAAARKAKAIQTANAKTATLTGCPICGNKVKAGRTYCSQRCGYIAHQYAPPKPKTVRTPKPTPPPPPARQCVVCGTASTDRRSRYCSEACMWEYNARKARERYRKKQGLPPTWDQPRTIYRDKLTAMDTSRVW